VRVGLAASLAVAGLVALALVYAGPAPYAALARGNGFERNVFHVPARALTQREVRYDVATLVALHEWTLRYVLDVFGATALPRDPTIGDPLFTADEQAHPLAHELLEVRPRLRGGRAPAPLTLPHGPDRRTDPAGATGRLECGQAVVRGVV